MKIFYSLNLLICVAFLTKAQTTYIPMPGTGEEQIGTPFLQTGDYLYCHTSAYDETYNTDILHIYRVNVFTNEVEEVEYFTSNSEIGTPSPLSDGYVSFQNIKEYAGEFYFNGTHTNIHRLNPNSNSLNHLTIAHYDFEIMDTSLIPIGGVGVAGSQEVVNINSPTQHYLPSFDLNPDDGYENIYAFRDAVKVGPNLYLYETYDHGYNIYKITNATYPNLAITRLWHSDTLDLGLSGSLDNYDYYPIVIGDKIFWEAANCWSDQDFRRVYAFDTSSNTLTNLFSTSCMENSFFTFRYNDYVYIRQESDGAIYRTNGENYAELTDLPPTILNSGHYLFYKGDNTLHKVHSVENNGYLYSATSPNDGFKIWKSDGTAAGTELLLFLENNYPEDYGIIYSLQFHDGILYAVMDVSQNDELGYSIYTYNPDNARVTNNNTDRIVNFELFYPTPVNFQFNTPLYFFEEDILFTGGDGDGNPVGLQNLDLVALKANQVNPNKFNIEVYPNPAKEKVHFSQNVTQVELFDMNGRKIKSSKNCSELNLLGIKPGNYILNFKNNQGKATSQKLIIE